MTLVVERELDICDGFDEVEVRPLPELPNEDAPGTVPYLVTAR